MTARHARQIRLAEVGTAGQARLAAARAEVHLSGDAARVAVRYLAGAGFGALGVPSAALAAEARAVDPDAPVEVVPSRAASSPSPSALASPSPFAYLDPAARDVAEGAALALAQIRRALESRG